MEGAQSNQQPPERPFGECRALHAALSDAWTYYRTRLSYGILKILFQSKNKIPDDEHGFVLDLCALSIDVDQDIFMAYTRIRQDYSYLLPELRDSIFDNPLDYARILKTIAVAGGGDVFDPDALLQQLQAQGFLMTPSMLTTVRSSTSSPLYRSLTESKTIKFCNRIVALDRAMKELAGIVEPRMGLLAPNLSALTGTAAAARLMGAAGGLSELSSMPILNILFLGANHNNNKEVEKHLLEGHGLIRTAIGPLPGFFFLYGIKNPLKACYFGQRLQCEACRKLSEYINIAAKMDLTGEHRTGSFGRAMQEEMCKMIDNCKEADSTAALLLMMRMQTERSTRSSKFDAKLKKVVKPPDKGRKHNNVMHNATKRRHVRNPLLERLTDSLKDMGLTISRSL